MAKHLVFTVGAGLVSAMCGAFVWAGCSGSVSNPPADAGMDTSKPPMDSGTPQDSATMDAPMEAAPPMDAGMDAPHQVLDSGPLLCGNAPCGTGTECCAVPTSPPPPPPPPADAGDAGDDGGSAEAGTGDGGVGFTLQCLAQCPDGGAPIQCDSPQQCGADAGGAICCGNLSLAGSGTSCSINSVSSACQSSCQTSLSIQPLCPATDIVQFCAQVADCTDPNYPACCTIPFQGQSETFCLSSAFAQEVGFIGGSCLH